MIRRPFKLILTAVVTSTIVGFGNAALAGAFQLFEQNAVNMGDFGAGGAAIADDASTAFYNPAGMIRIPNQQIVISGDDIITNLHFTGSNTWSSLSTALPSTPYTQTGSSQGGASDFVPAFHYVIPLNHCWSFGFSVGAPFGLETSYSQNDLLRYSATKTYLAVIDVSPDLAYRITDKFSLGAGPDIEHLNATLNAMVSPQAPGLDTLSENNAGAWGYGWHAGALYQFTPETRMGLAYHSQVHFNVQGTSTLSGPLAGLGISPIGSLSSNNLQVNAMLPPSSTLSIYHDINPQWAIDASANFTQWTQFNNVLTLQNVQGITIDPITSLAIPAFTDVSLPQHFSNAWRFAVGSQFKPCDKWLVRAGLGFDQTPVNGTYRNVRLPDSNRYAVAVGGHYQFCKAVGLDAGWTHLFMRNAAVNTTDMLGPQLSTTNGIYKNHADLVGAQLTLNIA